MSPRVLGVDACKTGWVGVVMDGGVATVHVAGTVAALVAEVELGGRLAAVGIDIPIGLPDTGRRQADLLAYRLVGPRRSSVFMTPVRVALAAASHPAAVQVNREQAGEGFSAQVYGLRAKIFEVDAWVRHTGRRVVEVHPEVTFAKMAGSPLTAGKRTWAGAHHRRRLLAAAGIHLTDNIGPAGERAAVDDVLDAGAVAWTTLRVATGTATPFSPTPVPLVQESVAMNPQGWRPAPRSCWPQRDPIVDPPRIRDTPVAARHESQRGERNSPFDNRTPAPPPSRHQYRRRRRSPVRRLRRALPSGTFRARSDLHSDAPTSAQQLVGNEEI